MSFKKGDRVKAIGFPLTDSLIGKIGTVREISGDGTPLVQWDGWGMGHEGGEGFVSKDMDCWWIVCEGSIERICLQIDEDGNII